MLGLSARRAPWNEGLRESGEGVPQNENRFSGVFSPSCALATPRHLSLARWLNLKEERLKLDKVCFARGSYTPIVLRNARSLVGRGRNFSFAGQHKDGESLWRQPGWSKVSLLWVGCWLTFPLALGRKPLVVLVHHGSYTAVPP